MMTEKPSPMAEPKVIRKTFTVPFRGGILELRGDTSPGVLAVIAQISLADPKIDAFYLAANATVKDLHGDVVWPKPPPQLEEEEPEGNGIIDLLEELQNA